MTVTHGSVRQRTWGNRLSCPKFAGTLAHQCFRTLPGSLCHTVRWLAIAVSDGGGRALYMGSFGWGPEQRAVWVRMEEFGERMVVRAGLAQGCQARRVVPHAMHRCSDAELRSLSIKVMWEILLPKTIQG